MIRCIMVDDEAAAIENLQRLVEWYCEDDLEVLGSAHNLTDARALIEEVNPQLIFLDVEMGKENGFMLLERIRQMPEPPEVIFTTGHSGYAIQALRKQAFDFLPKPVDPEDLQTAIKRLKSFLGEKQVAAPVGETTLNLHLQNEVRVCNIEDIIRCESEGSYTWFHFQNGDRLLVSRNLGSFEEKLLPHRFFRPHKSHLINLNYLQSYVRTEGGFILMKDEAQVPLARNQRQEFFDLLGI